MTDVGFPKIYIAFTKGDVSGPGYIILSGGGFAMWKYLGAALGLCALAAPAQGTVKVQARTFQISNVEAGTISYDMPFGSFAVFNTFGETLTRVTLQVDAWIEGTVIATNNTQPTLQDRNTFRDLGTTGILNVKISNPSLTLIASGSDSYVRNFLGKGADAPLFVRPSTVSQISITSNFNDFLVRNTLMMFNYEINLQTLYIESPDFAYSRMDVTGGQLTATLIYESGFVEPPPSGNVPEPATWATMVLGFGLAGYAMRRRARIIA